MTVATAATTEDRLLGGQVRLRQPAKGFRTGIDAVLLAAAIPARPGDTVVDVGCGVGGVALCLAARVPAATVVGLDREAPLVDLARVNAALNGWTDRVSFAVADVAALPAPMRGQFDHAATNPPYWRHGTRSSDPGRAGARHETDVTLDQWVAATGALVRDGGTITIVFRAERQSDLIAALAAVAGGVVLLPLVPRPEARPTLVIARAIKGGGSGLSMLSPLVLHEVGGAFTAATERVLRAGEPLALAAPGPEP
ncbi:MAG: methyltransferase domain-containing protein [Alphaproteobacteria bacterium]|nr:methyltransferase domain-containing protein [Alphaproteobacteria bacterium]